MRLLITVKDIVLVFSILNNTYSFFFGLFLALWLPSPLFLNLASVEFVVVEFLHLRSIFIYSEECKFVTILNDQAEDKDHILYEFSLHLP